MSKTSDFCNVTPRAAELNAALTAARAEAAMLREALEVARVVGEIQFPRCVLARQAREQIDAALSTSSNGWLDQKIAEATAALREERDELAVALNCFGPCPICGGYGTEVYLVQTPLSPDGEECTAPCACGGIDPAAILSAHDARIKAETRKAALLKAAALAGDRLSQSAGDIYRRLVDLANEEANHAWPDHG